jgi:hypothetical protein
VRLFFHVDIVSQSVFKERRRKINELRSFKVDDETTWCEVIGVVHNAPYILKQKQDWLRPVSRLL